MSESITANSWVDVECVLQKLGSDAPAPDDPILVNAMNNAAELLYALSGRQFPGSVRTTVRPTARPLNMTDISFSQQFSTWGFGAWSSSFGWGICRGCGYCGCNNPSMIGLGRSPIIEINEVVIDGFTIDPNDYTVMDDKWLVRETCSGGWPVCQNLMCDLDQENTFGVDFTFGQNPPISGQVAGCALATEFYKAENPDMSCTLPQRITNITRQGISFAILDPQTFLGQGLTGNYQIDLFIKAYNPNGQIRRPMVFSPDVPNMARNLGPYVDPRASNR